MVYTRFKPMVNKIHNLQGFGREEEHIDKWQIADVTLE
jgi:hypothetical protein